VVPWLSAVEATPVAHPAAAPIMIAAAAPPQPAFIQCMLICSPFSA
jgi:hypothetical protein